MICRHSLRWYKKYLQLPSLSHFQKVNTSTLNTSNSNSNNNIVWIDMEMTGLHVETSHIMEVACIITDKNLNIIGDELNLVINQPDEILENMNDWCMKHHKETGLTDESRLSKINVRNAEKILLNHLQKLIDTSTLKELILRWNLDVPKFTKSAEHRALADIKESIKELEHYKKHLFHL
ncbi:putative oligoribonuclease isoform X2 [Augochlora pura]